MSHSDPDLALAFGEERVLRAVSRGALWLTTALAALVVLVGHLSPAVGTVELALFLAVGPLFGAYAVARGAGLVPAALAVGAPLFALGAGALILDRSGVSLSLPAGFAPTEALGAAAFGWALGLVLAGALGLSLRALARRL